jgi:TipAS antibiotic-recognition protein
MQSALMKEMHNVEKYCALTQRREALGDEGMRRAEAQWASLIDRVRAAKNAGVDPASDEVRTLTLEWHSLVEAFTGGDAQIEELYTLRNQRIVAYCPLPIAHCPKPFARLTLLPRQ